MIGGSSTSDENQEIPQPPPCPRCGSKVISLERRPNGNARCEKGCVIPYPEYYQKPQGYNHETDRRVTAKEMDEAIAKEIEPIKSRNIQLESEITQKNMKIRHLEELLKEKSSGLTNKFNKSKDVQDGQ